ncbi:MAG: hypothetical protein JSV66_15575 [Trueperaceae bacterium]|nr:MAG: hypothetical protein JSV66_15575 [Trueperaceae bacterium]
MKILFDQGVPVPLRRHLTGHEISTAFELQWSALSNGDLIEQAELAGFQLLITTDQNLRYQQNLSARRLAVVVLMSTSWPRIRQKASSIEDALHQLESGAYLEITIP